MVHPLDNRPILRMNGAGNEILVLDLRGLGHELSPSEARAIAAQPGLRFDQLMALHDPRTAGDDAFMRIYNIDGSLSGACGNGTRCVAWALAREGKTSLRLETDAGRIETRRETDALFTVDMGAPSLDWSDIPLAHAADTAGSGRAGAVQRRKYGQSARRIFCVRRRQNRSRYARPRD
jgi:diaminopimelate epimerase